MSYHFGKPKRRPFRWSKQNFDVASYFGEIGLQMSNIQVMLDKKAILFSFFFLGSMKDILLRIPKWYGTPWKHISNPLKSEKNQILVFLPNTKPGLEAIKMILMLNQSHHWKALTTSFPKWCIMMGVIGEHVLASMASER